MAVALSLAAWLCRADERHVDFVHALQERGLADMAVAYLEKLAAQGDLPEELGETFDFELGDSLVLLADESDPETEAKLLDRATASFQKYLKEHPDSDEAISARSQLASVFLKRGQRQLATAEVEKAAPRKVELKQAARKTLEQARTGLAEAVQQYRGALSKLSPADAAPATATPPAASPEPAGKAKPATEKKRATIVPKKAPVAKKVRRTRSASDEARIERLESAMVIAQLNAAMTEFHIGRTFEPNDAKRGETFRGAAKQFDDVFQRFRAIGAIAGHFAHLWHGRTLQEAGDWKTALAIYDEVVVNEPPPGAEQSRESEALFAQAFLFRYQIMNQQGQHAELLSDSAVGAELWLRGHPNERRSPHGLGVQLEMVKAIAGLAGKLPAGSPERRQLFARAMKMLNDDVTRYPSPYQNDGFRLRQQYAAEISVAGAKPASFDEATFCGDVALGQSRWAEAIQAYATGLSLANANTDPEELATAQYRLAYSYYRAGKLAEAAQAAEAAVQQNATAKAAPEAAGVAMVALYAGVTGAQTTAERDAASAKLLDMASRVEKTWPDLSQADHARQFRGVLLQLQRDYAGAAAAFEAIREGSPLYADGQIRCGLAYWGAYGTEMAKPAAEQNQAGMQEWLGKAQAALEQGIALRRESLAKGAPVPPTLLEAELTQAEISLRTGDPKAASALLDPLVPLIQDPKRKDLERFVLRVLVATLESAIAQGDLTRAEQLMQQTLQQGASDSTRITQVLVQLGRSLEQRMRNHEQAGEADKAAAVRKTYEGMLGRLAERAPQDLSSLYYLAESYYALASYDKAVAMYDRILQSAGAGADPAQISRFKLRRATALRLQKQFSLALPAIDELLKAHEQAAGRTNRPTFPITYMMEKGRILQEWGESDPKQLDAAARHWNTIAQRLQAAAPKPVEYFEARYGIAWCFSKLRRSDDAARVLRSTMSLNPNCGSPEMKAKYESLLKQLPSAPATAGAQ
jgi:tetratricopeptide (TPR) repeat protein